MSVSVITLAIIASYAVTRNNHHRWLWLLGCSWLIISSLCVRHSVLMMTLWMIRFVMISFRHYFANSYYFNGFVCYCSLVGCFVVLSLSCLVFIMVWLFVVINHLAIIPLIMISLLIVLGCWLVSCCELLSTL